MEILKPPPALLKVDGKEQVSGIGSYCWNEADRVLGITMSSTSICADYGGIHTPVEPLPTSSPFTAHLILPLKEPPEGLQFNVIRVTDEDETIQSFANDRAWHIKDGNYSNLTLESELDKGCDIVRRVSPEFKLVWESSRYSMKQEAPCESKE